MEAKKTIQANIDELYTAIKDQNSQEAYVSFNNVITHFHVQVDLSEIFPIKPHLLDPDFIINPVWILQPILKNPEDMNWSLLTDHLIKILKRNRNEIEKYISPEQLDKMISELIMLLEKTYEEVCLKCGNVIKANEDGCGKCGWSWKDKH